MNWNKNYKRDIIIKKYDIIDIGVDSMTRYYCSGFDINNAFGHGLGDMFLSELKK